MKRNRELELPKYAVLDGGSATELVRMGYEFIDNDPLWSARLLATNPDAIKQMHLSFLEAGSDIIETCTYQASIDGFVQHLSITPDKAAELIKLGVKLAKQVRDDYWQKTGQMEQGRKRPLVAGSIGPYGACLHDGSEYTGAYVDTISTEELREWHRPRMKLLVEAGVDLLAVETIPAMKEAQAITELLAEFPQIKAWISFSCKDEKHVNHGEAFMAAAASVISHEQVVGVGVNCTPPQQVTSLIQSVKTIINKKLIVVYPNSGETWTHDKRWQQSPVCRPVINYVPEWIREGANWIGGCCRISPSDVARIRAALEHVL